jgi:hypothetical protein
MPLPHYLIPQEDDAPNFLALVDTVISAIDKRIQPQEIFQTRIKGWFDHKWLKYAGKAVIPFSQGLPGQDSALEARWKEHNITFPPFNPNRVLNEWRRFGKGAPIRKEDWTTAKWQDSNANLQNRIADHADPAVYIWYSSGTRTSTRGSLMVYQVSNGNVECFYASLRKEEDRWQFAQCKGIGRRELEAMV